LFQRSDEAFVGGIASRVEDAVELQEIASMKGNGRCLI
jgi:hypothetical protein